MSDHAFMAQAIALAKRGIYSTHPNPRVGCVIVKDGKIVGEGFHIRAGQGHAEVNALTMAGDNAQGATAYVTLEPCSHHGRTPPCAEALVKAGVARVVAAMTDPNPQVAGRGLKRLRDAGIEVSSGVLEAEARALNLGFFKRMEKGLPYVRIKLAMSVDGRTAMQSGESQWITGPCARQMVQRLRAESGAIITGADTVLLDNARLTVRGDELGLEGEALALATERAPLRVLIDGKRRVPVTAPFFSAPNALVASCQEDPALHEAGIAHWQFAGENVDLRALLKKLAEQGVNEVLVEAGAALAGAFAAQNLVDEYLIFMAPKLMGSSARALLDLPISQMQDAKDLEIVDIRAVGQDWLIQAKPAPLA